MNKINLFDSNKLLKARDVAETLKISKSMAYKLIRTGDIPSVHIGSSRRVRPSDLQGYINSHVKNTKSTADPEVSKDHDQLEV